MRSYDRDGDIDNEETTMMLTMIDASGDDRS